MASSTTTTASSALDTGFPLASFSVTLNMVSPPGSNWLTSGVTSSVSVRCNGGMFNLSWAVAKAGRGSAFFSTFPWSSRPLRRTNQVHLDVQIGDIFSLDRNGEGGGTILDLEAGGVEEPAAADGEQTFRRAEGRLHQYLGSITGLVILLVRDQRDFFLLHVAGRRSVVRR